MPTPLEERAFGRDLYFPLDHTEPITVTPTGDIATVAGNDTVNQGALRRVLTNPGSMTWRPEYGGGTQLYIEQNPDPGTLAAIARDNKRNVLQDPRVSDVVVGVSDEGAGVVGIELDIKTRNLEERSSVGVEVRL